MPNSTDSHSVYITQQFNYCTFPISCFVRNHGASKAAGVAFFDPSACKFEEVVGEM